MFHIVGSGYSSFSFHMYSSLIIFKKNEIFSLSYCTSSFIVGYLFLKTN